MPHGELNGNILAPIELKDAENNCVVLLFGSLQIQSEWPAAMSIVYKKDDVSNNFYVYEEINFANND